MLFWILVGVFVLACLFDAITTIMGIEKYGLREAKKFACWYHRWRHGGRAGRRGQFPKPIHVFEFTGVEILIVAVATVIEQITSGQTGVILIVTTGFKIYYFLTNLRTVRKAKASIK